MSARADDDMKKMTVIGSAGAGKSTLCNIFAGKKHDDDTFPVGDEWTSCTHATSGKIVKWRGTSGRKIHLFDTPGLKNEDSGADNYNIDQMVDYFKNAWYVNVFLLVINGANPRFDSSLISMLKVFHKMFGKTFLQDNGVLAITNWAFDSKSIKRRGKKDNDETVTKLIQRLQDLQFIEEDKNIPVLFIDALHDSEDQYEVQKFNEEMIKLWDAINEYPALTSSTFRVVNVDDNKLAHPSQGKFSVWRIGGDSNKWFGVDEDDENVENNGTKKKTEVAAKAVLKVAAGAAGEFADDTVAAALKIGGKAMAENTGKVLGGVGAGLGIAIGTGEMGYAIYSLIAGSADLKTVDDIYNAIMEARDRPLVRITQRELEALDKAATDLSSLVEKIKKYHSRVNGTKASSGGVSAVGGGLTVAGIFFPPVLIAGVALSVIGASFSFMASMFELTLKHKEKLKSIMDQLLEVRIVVKEVNHQEDDETGR